MKNLQEQKKETKDFSREKKWMRENDSLIFTMVSTRLLVGYLSRATKIIKVSVQKVTIYRVTIHRVFFCHTLFTS